MVKLQPFDTAQHLDNPEVMRWYLAEALESGDAKLFLRAVHNVARAKNMSKIAREIGMSRTSLYWGENTSPEFTTVLRLLDTLGIRLRVEPIADAPRKLGKRLIKAADEALAIARGGLDPKTYRVHRPDDDDAGRPLRLKIYRRPGPGMVRFRAVKASAKHRTAPARKKK
jgi:probable addiction module antidote protein